jgi:extradiol dioxygenase family protein
MIGRLHAPVIDCPDPAGLAAFYAELLGAKVTKERADWVTIEDPDGNRVSFQRAPDYEAPRFPDPASAQQIHLDIEVEDIDEAEWRVLELGATSAHSQGADFRVYLDPVGHPFCLVWTV